MCLKRIDQRKKNQTSSATIQLLALFCGTILLVGCVGSVALHNDTIDYSDDYANDTNQQLLNNLARMAQSDPPYFVQVGQITALHTFTGTAGFGSATASSQADHYGGAVGLTGTEQPTFQFVPITGTNFMAAISTPIPSKLFLTFFDQGKPADLLARVMLDSVVVADNESTNDHGKKWVYHLLRNDPLDPSYPDFLLFCIQLRDKQLHDSDFVETPTGKRVIYLTGVKASDVTTTLPPGMDIGPANSTNASGSTSNRVAFLGDPNTSNNVISPPNEVFITKARDVTLLEQYDTQYLTNYASNNYRYSFERGSNGQNLGRRRTVHFTYTATIPNLEHESSTTDNAEIAWWASMKMRTFMSVLSATAKEEARFKEASQQGVFDQANTVFSIGKDGYGCYYDQFADSNKKYWVQPILRLSQDDAGLLAEKFGSRTLGDGNDFHHLVSIDYKGDHYVLGDIIDSNGLPLVNILRDTYHDEDSLHRSLGRQTAALLSSNKEVFGLISDLYSDIAIDPKSLPVQQLIQVQ